MKKKIFLAVKLLAITMVGFILYWGVSLLECEILTRRYEDEFLGLYKQTNMIERVDYLKVLKYSEETAKVYYITNDVQGATLEFKKVDRRWQMQQCKVVWSSTGSASDIQWPYFWFFGGL